jgi:hypothetical protein
VKPGDIIMYRDMVWGKHHRFYEIEGVHLGATGEVGLIRLRSLTETPGHGADGKLIDQIYVPEPLLRNATLFSRQDTP